MLIRFQAWFEFKVLEKIYFENKTMATLMLNFPKSIPMPYTYLRNALWFHIAIFYILSLFKQFASLVMMCSFSTLVIHVHDTKYCPTNMVIIQARQPLKGNESKGMSYHAQVPRLKKSETGIGWKEQKIQLTNMYLCLNLHMIRVHEWLCYLET